MTARRIARLALQISSGIILIILLWSCTAIPGINEEVMTPVIRVPFVRVLMVESKNEVRIDADGSMAIECISGGQQTVYYSQTVTLTMYGVKLRAVNNHGDVIQDGSDEINFIPRGTGSHIRYDGRRYRGMFKALPNGNNVRVVNILYMEDYLRGVVPPEIGPRNDSETEAIKTQAVAARTYAMGHLGQYGTEPYDMKSTVVDQIYEGMESEVDLVDRAIDATTGQVIMFQGNYINAYYHSTCGGMTDNIEEVWDKPAAPYLKPVPDSGACSWSKYYDWSEKFTEPQLRGRIEQYLSSDRGKEIRLAPITDIAVSERTAGGRVAKLTIRTKDDTYRFYKDRIRWVIGRASNPDLILPSDKFDVELDRGDKDKLSSITIHGGGYGHGVGLCQCGAIGMSRKGWTFDQIIPYYYRGVEIRKLY
jgi:stage II sporulation protein D